jgi:hypothetical protein
MLRLDEDNLPCEPGLNGGLTRRIAQLAADLHPLRVSTGRGEPGPFQL